MPEPMVLKARADGAVRGTPPGRRPIADHLRLGVVNLDKPSGPTSHQVVSWLKLALGLERAGHAGTLDPNVTGVLPVALSDATRALQAMLLGSKEYVGVLRLHGDVPAKRTEEVMREFTGPIYQMPPLKSAVKRELRVRTIHRLVILERDGRDILFRCVCESGTYIRKLCADVGTVLGVGANMAELRRARSAGFGESDAVSLHGVRDAWHAWKEEGDEAELRRVVRPMEEMLSHLPRIVVRDSAVDALCHGADLAAPGILEVQRGVEKGQAVAAFTRAGEGIALGHALLDADAMLAASSGLAVDVDRVLMAPGTYPKGWS